MHRVSLLNNYTRGNISAIAALCTINILLNWKKHWTGKTRSAYGASIIDPFLAVKGLSMSLSGTDYYTHLDFQKQAEQYRRSFVQHMNRNMQNHSKLGDWDYRVDHSVYEEVLSFRYKQPGISKSVKPYIISLGSLLI